MRFDADMVGQPVELKLDTKIVWTSRWECSLCGHRWLERADRPPECCPKCSSLRCLCPSCSVVAEIDVKIAEITEEEKP